MKHYYLVNGESYLTAVEAWNKIYHLGNTGQLNGYELILDNDRLTAYNWLSQPVKTIRQLEDERATQIRSKYDYVRVLYSGGSDSHSIVEAFLRSNNHIDEIIMYEWKNVIHERIDSPHNTRTKQRWLHELCTKYGKDVPPITVLTVDENVINSHFCKNWFLNHQGHAGTESFSVNHVADMVELCPQPQGRDNVGTVLGMEKPRLFSDGETIWFQMNDKNTLYGASTKHDVEWFYLSADCPDLINAQCRGAIKVARSLLGHLPIDKALERLQTSPDYYHEWCVSVGRTSTRFQNMQSKAGKNIGHSVGKTGYYNHIPAYQKSQYWKNYLDFVNTMNSLNGGQIVPGINTKRFVVEVLKK